MAKVYKKSGGNSWQNKFKTTPSHPSYTGEIWIDYEQLQDLVASAKANTNPDDMENKHKALVKTALWERTTKEKPDGTGGKPYFYVQLEVVSQEDINPNSPPQASIVDTSPSSEEPNDQIPF
mgnify:CR=1 FL=1|tara:strand:+ start:4797 stop:5162 length:366 start_codon:yes stop_codon:yes gene_type:complete